VIQDAKLCRAFYQNFWEEAAVKILQKTKPMEFDPEAQTNPISLQERIFT
jgi:hypothetical protein